MVPEGTGIALPARSVTVTALCTPAFMACVVSVARATPPSTVKSNEAWTAAHTGVARQDGPRYPAGRGLVCVCQPGESQRLRLAQRLLRVRVHGDEAESGRIAARSRIEEGPKPAAPFEVSLGNGLLPLSQEAQALPGDQAMRIGDGSRPKTRCGPATLGVLRSHR